MCLRYKIFDLFFQWIVVAESHGKDNRIISSCLVTYSVSCLVLYTVFIEFAYLCSGDLFDSVVLEIFHEIYSMLVDHVCTYSITELDNCYIMLLLA